MSSEKDISFHIFFCPVLNVSLTFIHTSICCSSTQHLVWDTFHRTSSNFFYDACFAKVLQKKISIQLNARALCSDKEHWATTLLSLDIDSDVAARLAVIVFSYAGKHSKSECLYIMIHSQQCKMNNKKKVFSVEHNKRMCFILETGLGGNDWTVNEAKQ
jgi:hypothetical protein